MVMAMATAEVVVSWLEDLAVEMDAVLGTDPECSWVTLSAAALFLTQSSSTLRHMIPATLPLVALIVFGTTKVSTISYIYLQ